MALSSVGGVNQDQFLQLLIAQLQNQDPLSPTSPGEFISQLSSLSTVQGLQSLNASFAEVLRLQQVSEGVNLIGKTVSYTPAGGGAAVSGKVDSVTVQNGQFVLQVGDTGVKLDQIVSVRNG